MSCGHIISAERVDSMIANGDTIVIFQDYVLRLDSWLERHPGGRLAILHMVGRDATDEITVYHDERTLRTMKAYRIGHRPMGLWINRTPPIRGGVFQSSRPAEQVLNRSGSSETVTNIASLGQGLERHSQHVLAESKKASRGDEAAKAQMVMAITESRADWAIQQDRIKDSKAYPLAVANTQADIASKYRLLHRRVRDASLYSCPYIEYSKEVARYVALFALFLYLLKHDQYIASAVFLGLFWHQIMFTAHDAGHRAITHEFTIDTLIGLFIADFCCGLSLGWWKSSHNVHHLTTNMPAHDPDIQNLPLFATCPSFFKSLRSSYYDGFAFIWDATAGFLIPHQKYTYYPVMAIARFNLYLLSWLHVVSSKSLSLGSSKAWWIRPTELVFMSCYWILFGYLLVWRSLPTWTARVAFVLVSHAVTMPLHVQITLSHWGMSTSNLDEEESFPQRQLRTTLDISCPAWLDFLHGGLQFQAVHHLFPRLPRHNLRKAQVMVREFCADTGIPYSILGFIDGNRKVIGRLEEISEQARMLVSCQKYMAETGESGLR